MSGPFGDALFDRIDIESDASDRAWALSTNSSTLIVGFEDGALTQRYWGSRLPAGAVAGFASMDRQRWNSSFQRPAEVEEQLPFDGGHRWGVPSLQVVFAGGVRSLELDFHSATKSVGSDEATLVILLVDTSFQLEVALHYRLRSNTDVIERWVELTNDHASEAAEIRRADSGSWLMPDLSNYRASTVHGYWAAETQLQRLTLPIGEYTLTSRHGTTGQQSSPWIMIDDGTATEEFGEVRTVALAWSGSWRLTAQRRPEGMVAVTTGFGHEGLSWKLSPGSSLSTPPTLGLFSRAGFGGTSRAWHDYARAFVLPKGAEDRPILFNSWEATEFEVSESGQIKLAERAASMGVELFVVDDGWFGHRTHDAAGLGDWYPNPGRFPNGLHGIADAVSALGMQFGLWVEPEMVNPDSDLYRSNPDWVLHWPGRKRDERRNQLVVNFGRADVRDWALAWLSQLVRDYSLSFLKWDMNRPFTQAGWPDLTGNQDLVWIEHTRGVYTVMDSLRAEFPNLRIEACSSGGGRVDLGILSRTDQVWTSDNTDSLDRQVIQHGFSQLYPAVTMGAWVTETVNAMTGRHIPLAYRFHVAMAGNLGIGGNLDEWGDEEIERATALIARYKYIRTTVQHGRQYRLGGAPGREFSAIQYVNDEQVVVLAYEPHRSLATTPRRLRLQGLQPGATYLNEDTGTLTTGAELAERGILFNDESNLRGWNNTKFSTADYASSLTIFRRVAS